MESIHSIASTLIDEHRSGLYGKARAVLRKIDVTPILRDHIQTLRDHRTGKVSYSDVLLFFFLPAYGITADVVRRRPWQRVQEAMEQQLEVVVRKSFWMGFFYLTSGRQSR